MPEGAAAPAEGAPKKEQKPKEPKAKKEKKGGGDAAVNTDHIPVFCSERQKVFERLWEKQQEEYGEKAKDIKVTMPDGKQHDAVAWKTTPVDIAKKISNSLPDKIFVARVEEAGSRKQLWDLGRPLEEDCSLEFLDWDCAESKQVFWHSSAHILGAAMEIMYDAQLSTGPPQPEEKGGGFFYEADTSSKAVSEGDYAALDGIVKKVTGGKHPFQRLVISKEEALQLFGYNKFKVATLSDKVEDGKTCTVYRCGPLIDPCRGPHVLTTGRVKAIKVYNNSSSYWRNKDTNPTLQRVYGISYPKADLMKQWDERRQTAKEMDHRRTGTRQGLWMFHDLSPGSAFWHPRGARIYNRLMDFVRGEYRKRGFEEVITPNMYNKKLWETSGHWAKYSEDMFRLEVEKELFALKPMNCPGHCLMFAAGRHSYKELPIRFADFGVLHRNELAGALSGLTRVRRFQQDDAHIFCLRDQLVQEIAKALEFVEYVYKVFGFKFHLALSTRPETRIGSAEIWDDAESRLERSLNMFCGMGKDGDGMVEDPHRPGETFHFSGTEEDVKKVKKLMDDKGEDCPVRYIWKLNEGDGAFYGPKIDIRVEDAMLRLHQLGTVQLDFNLPQRFDLTYDDGKKKEALNYDGETLVTPAATFFEPSEENPMVSKDGYLRSRCVKGNEAKALLEESRKPRPVMIHRAILGSLERCVAILAEHWKGNWPFWVSPRQAIVIPISHNFDDYARQVKDQLYGSGFDVDMDIGSNTLDKKVREAQVARYNFILVVGEKDKDAGGATVRTRDNKQHGMKTLDEILAWWTGLVREKPLDL
eukprot:Hpha_TRINITY_DN16887_c0_g1::TRINITY_DN16887_c0_g1_i1::g.153384::m.153384/K01868/TARS, thrS; threonyl-tRNA synthetase